MTRTFHSDRTNASVTPDIVCGFAVVFPDVCRVYIQDVDAREQVLRHDLVLLPTPELSLVFVPRDLKGGCSLKLTLQVNISSFKRLNRKRLFAEHRWFWDWRGKGKSIRIDFIFRQM